MNTAWVMAWSIRPKVALSKAKPPASERAEICRSCFLAQLMAGSKALVSKARMAGLMVPVLRHNKAQIAAKAAFGSMMAIKHCLREFQQCGWFNSGRGTAGGRLPRWAVTARAG